MNKSRGDIFITIRSRDLISTALDDNNNAGRFNLFSNILAEDNEILTVELVSATIPNSFYNLSNNNLIDHIDINSFDNRIENLRVVNKSQNIRNQKKRKNCSSKYKGVCWHNSANKWQVKISIDGKAKHLGLFNNEEEAGEAYKKKYDEIMKF